MKIREDILHRHKACPYTGEFLSGAVQMTMVNGRVVFDSRLEYFDKTEKTQDNGFCKSNRDHQGEEPGFVKLTDLAAEGWEEKYYMPPTTSRKRKISLNPAGEFL